VYPDALNKDPLRVQKSKLVVGIT